MQRIAEGRDSTHAVEVGLHVIEGGGNIGHLLGGDLLAVVAEAAQGHH